MNSSINQRPSSPVLLTGLFIMALLSGSALPDDSPTPFVTSVVAYEAASIERTFDGTVEAVHQATVSAQTGGRIAEVNYDVDDFVIADSVLLSFTDAEQRTALNQAEAARAEAQAILVETEEEYRRAQNLQERGLGSQRDLDRALAGRDSAVARTNAAASVVKAAQQQLDYTVVKAPYAGIVTQRHVEVGETVAPGQALMSGLSLEKLRIVVDLPQQVAAEVRLDPQASIVTGEGRIVPVKITLFPIADPVTNTFRVRLDLPDGQFGLYPGMFVKAAFKVGEAQRLLIPAQALVRRSEVTAVYVAAGTGVRLRQVRIGERFNDRIEVLAGLEKDELIVLDPVQAGIFAKSAGQPQP